MPETAAILGNVGLVNASWQVKCDGGDEADRADAGFTLRRLPCLAKVVSC